MLCLGFLLHLGSIANPDVPSLANFADGRASQSYAIRDAWPISRRHGR